MSSAEPLAPPEAGTAYPDQFHYASFARRLAAFALDFCIFTGLQFAIGILIGILFGIVIEMVGGLSEGNVDFILTILGFTIVWLYYATLECSSWQATFGKKLLGIKVVDLRGNRISFLRATTRSFAKVLSALMFIGFIIIDFTPKKQGLHDMIAGCLVVKQPANVKAT